MMILRFKGISVAVLVLCLVLIATGFLLSTLVAAKPDEETTVVSTASLPAMSDSAGVNVSVRIATAIRIESDGTFTSNTPVRAQTNDGASTLISL